MSSGNQEAIIEEPSDADLFRGLQQETATEKAAILKKEQENQEMSMVPLIYENIKDTHGQLSGLIDHIDEKVSEMLEFHETDFLRAFKDQMNLVSKELEMLKKKMDENILKLAHDKKLISLEKQVEFFRSQALLLNSEREGIFG